MAEELEISPLFTGLTRPPLLAGVPLDYMSICAMVVICIFILGNSFFYLITYFPLHILGWIACKYDPNIFSIVFKKIECTVTPNKKIWETQAYDPF